MNGLQVTVDEVLGKTELKVQGRRHLVRPPLLCPAHHLPARLADAICSLPVCAFKLCSIIVQLFARAASVRIYACTSTTCWNGPGGKKCVHSVEKEKEGWNQYNS